MVGERIALRERRPLRHPQRRDADAREDDDTAHELQRLGPVTEEDDRHGERQDRDEVRGHRGDPRTDATHDPVEEREAADGYDEGEIERVDPHARVPAAKVAVALLEEAEGQE